MPILAPDETAGALIDSRSPDPRSPGVTLWAGPAGWDRAKARFTVDTPSHLVAATAAAMLDPSPVVRERHMIPRDVEHLVQLEPVAAETHARERAPTPLDAKRAAAFAAVQRAVHSQPGTKRAQAARIRTTHHRPRPTTVSASPARTDASPRQVARPR